MVRLRLICANRTNRDDDRLRNLVEGGCEKMNQRRDWTALEARLTICSEHQRIGHALPLLGRHALPMRISFSKKNDVQPADHPRQ